MYDIQSNQILNINDANKKNKKYFTNVFSNLAKPENGKQYQKLQIGLNLLNNEVKLLNEYDNRDNFVRKKKYRLNTLNNDNKKRRFNIRDSIFFLKKKNFRKSRNLNLMHNSLTKRDSINDTHNKTKENKNINNSQNSNYLIYKTEANNKYPDLANEKKINKLKLNLCQSSETNIETNTNNINGSTSSRLPALNNKSGRQIYLSTENNENKNNSQNKKINYKKYYIPIKNINSRNNTFIKKYPQIFNSQRLKNRINKDELSNSTEKISRIMQEKNIKIKKRINYKLTESNYINWEMKSKIKLAQWKYGIEEIDKYFVDLKAYGKPAEEELIKRKTFYDEVEDLIDEIKKEKTERNIKKITKEYNNKETKNKNRGDKNNQGNNNDINMVDNVRNKHSELSEALKHVKNRKINEERVRQLINNMLIKSELKSRFINISTDRLMRKLESENYENSINKTNRIFDKVKIEKPHGILINKVKKKHKEKDSDNEKEISEDLDIYE